MRRKKKEWETVSAKGRAWAKRPGVCRKFGTAAASSVKQEAAEGAQVAHALVA